MNIRQQHQTGFLDLLFNFLLITTILLMFSVLFVSEKKKDNDANILSKAEFVFTANWQRNLDNDIDVWIEDPEENILWYRQKQIGVMHLDRDDLGHCGEYRQPDQPWEDNQEIATIRGFIEGEWVINLHFYRQGNTEPTIVNVAFIKLNPSAKIIFKKKIKLTYVWEEITVARLIMTRSGTLIQVEDGPFKSLVSTAHP